MAITCWAPGCNHNNKRDSCKFFRFPINKKEYQRWITLVRRDDKPGTGARLCSCHFRSGKKENGPEIFTRNEGKLFEEHHLTPEKKTPRKRKMLYTESQPSTSAVESDNLPPCSKKLQPQSHFEESLPGTSKDVTVLDVQGPSIIDVPSTSHSSQTKPSTVMLEAEIYLAKLEAERKDEIIKTLKIHMTYENICESDKLILEYTGLPRRDIFEALYKLIEDTKINYYLKWNVQKLSKIDQLLMTLMKLRQNFPYTDLSYRFQVSESTVTNVVVTFIHVLHEILFKVLMKDIPSRRKNLSCLPNCASTFTNCRIILDATEIFSAVPRQSMKFQRLTYSSYKHRNTFKGLVGVAPNGVVTYVSNLYPGSTSDKAIVKHCGVLSKFVPGDLILADKGFLIRELLPAGVSLNVPPFLSTPQFTPEQVRRTECIAKARIHVERAICRMKSYKILSFIPERLFSYSSIIFQTVGALTNLQYPLIKEVADFYEK